MEKEKRKKKIPNVNEIVFYSPKMVTEPDTSKERIHTTAILIPTIRLVEYACLVFSGFLIPRYLPQLIEHMCIMLQEQANTSHDTYTLHQTIPKGQ